MKFFNTFVLFCNSFFVFYFLVMADALQTPKIEFFYLTEISGFFSWEVHNFVQDKIFVPRIASKAQREKFSRILKNT